MDSAHCESPFGSFALLSHEGSLNGEPFEPKARAQIPLFQRSERQGFEPWGPLRAQRFSRPPRSTAPAPLRQKSFACYPPYGSG